ncbi:putative acetyltransferase At3g50280 [Silene latifolia]|uniref:putative acetyltransferase At3g50280 n=1 Tax=Silene latifolia TaxID=37657 RepID=UPI003D77E2B7
MPKAKLISETFVRPKIEVDESKRVHHLNPFDLRMLLFDTAQLGYIYAKPPSNSIPSSYLESLKSSLSQALVHFYPLAGRLVTVPNLSDHSCYVYVDCNIGPGARFIHASAHDVSMIHVLSLDSDFAKVVRSFFDLGEVSINYDGHTRPLLSVQVTELYDGVFFGICFNHSIVDGVSLHHFQRVWSHIFMGTFSSSICLPIIKQPEYLFGKVVNLPYLDPKEFVIRSTTEVNVMGRFFRFSSQSLKNIKRIANSDSSVPISTFKSLIAFVWKCITRARNLNPDDPTICGLPVNLRPRFNPPLTDDYFGNYAIKAIARVKVGDLLGNTVGWAATLLNKAVEAQDDKSARGRIKRAMEMGPELSAPALICGTNDVVVGSSPRFELSDSRFGLGRLIGFRGGYGNTLDGKVNAYLGVEGDGSVDLDIRLVPHTMDALLLDREFMSFVSLDNAHFDLVS